MNPSRLAAVAVSLVLVGALAACADDVPSPSPSAAPSVPAAAQETPPPSHNDADASFAQMMTVHHEGAVEMAGLAASNAGSQDVRDLALAISAAQGPEIESMTWWLDSWGEESAAQTATETVDAEPEHAGMLMDGLDHEAAMLELTLLTGADFDRRFLELMVSHHAGAVVMAQAEVAEGLSAEAVALAETIVEDQEAEIVVMGGLLATR